MTACISAGTFGHAAPASANTRCTYIPNPTTYDEICYPLLEDCRILWNGKILYCYI